MNYDLWVDLRNKLLSTSEQDGFDRYSYESEAGYQRVLKLLAADGYQMCHHTMQSAN